MTGPVRGLKPVFRPLQPPIPLAQVRARIRPTFAEVCVTFGLVAGCIASLYACAVLG